MAQSVNGVVTKPDTPESVAKANQPIPDKAVSTPAADSTQKVENPAPANTSTAGAPPPAMAEANDLLPSIPVQAAQAAPAASDWPTFQDASLSAASNLMKTSGLTYADAKAFFAKARESGKLEDVDLTTMKAKIGEDKTQLVMAGIREYYNTQVNAAKATTAAVFTIVGGKDAWGTIASWAATKEQSDPAFAKDLKDYRDMITKGGASATAAATALKDAYTKDPNNSGLNKTMIEGDRAPQPVNNSPLSAKEYSTQIRKAYKDNDRKLIAELQARRRAAPDFVKGSMKNPRS